MDLARDGKEGHGGCPWFINDPEANFCFFKYMADHGAREVEPTKIAAKLMIDDSEVKRIVQGFKKKAREVLDPTPPKKK